jgi:hypothetical protein
MGTPKFLPLVDKNTDDGWTGNAKQRNSGNTTQFSFLPDFETLLFHTDFRSFNPKLKMSSILPEWQNGNIFFTLVLICNALCVHYFQGLFRNFMVKDKGIMGSLGQRLSSARVTTHPQLHNIVRFWLPKPDFPGGHPSWDCSRKSTLNCGVLIGS